MILPDVNVLVYAFREGAQDHRHYADWLAGIVAGADELALVDTVLLGFVRVVTNPRIADPPAETARALAFVRVLREAPRSAWLGSGKAVWEHLQVLADEDRHIAGNLLPDAYLAAVALAHNATVATADRGFARFPGIRWFDPARG